MTVGQQKQKWTPEEEAALRAGVEKYGAGKWRAIQKDDDFGHILVSRSNVDLKDKWRNISATSNGNRNRGKGTGQKGGRRAKSQEGSDKEELSPVPDSEKKLGVKYDNIILGAIATLNEPNGSSMTDIAEHIEETQPAVPPGFKKLVVSKLKAMMIEGKILKVHQNYKINDEFPSDGRAKPQRLRNNQDDKQQPTFARDITRKLRTDSASKRTKLDPEAAERRRAAEEAARVAVVAMAYAEQAALAAEQAARESEAAEQEADMKQAAAEAALAATKTKKPIKAVAAAMGREVVAVTV